MSGIVGSGRHFVGQQSTLVLKKLNGQHSDILKRLKHPPRGILGCPLYGGVKPRCRGERKPQDALPMVILDQRIKCSFPRASPHSQQAHLTCERNEALQNERGILLTDAVDTEFTLVRFTFRRELGLCSLDFFGTAQNPLALPVVTHSTGL